METYQPKGLFITKNDKGQFIYSDIFMRGGYIIGKSNYQKYRTYALRYVIGIIVAILLSTFINITPSIIIGLLTTLIGEVLFRVKFLKKSCSYITDFSKDTKSTIINNLSTNSPISKRIIKIVLLVAFGILLIYYAYDQSYTGLYFYACWTIGIIACLMALFLTILLIKDGGKK